MNTPPILLRALNEEFDLEYNPEIIPFELLLEHIKLDRTVLLYQ
jgi:hypothetical protein